MIIVGGDHGVHSEEQTPNRESPFNLLALLPIREKESDGVVEIVGVLLRCFAHEGANILQGHVR